MRALASLIAFVSVSAAAAATPDQLVAEAERAWSDLDYERVLTLADATLRAPESAPRHWVEALRLRGAAYVVLGRTAEATLAFETLFRLDPDYELPERTSPRILAVFRPARASWQVKIEERLAGELGAQLAAFRLEPAVPARGEGGRPLVIAVGVVDPSGIAADVVLAWRRDAGAWSTLTAVPRPRLELTIPAEVTASDRPYTIELHLRARHRSGVTLRRAGDAEHPLRVPMAPGQVPREPPLTRRWYFWAGAAALAAGAVAIPILVEQARDVGPQTIAPETP